MGNRKGDKRLFSFRKFAFRKHGPVTFKELLGRFRGLFSDLFEFGLINRRVVALHHTFLLAVTRILPSDTVSGRLKSLS